MRPVPLSETAITTLQFLADRCSTSPYLIDRAKTNSVLREIETKRTNTDDKQKASPNVHNHQNACVRPRRTEVVASSLELDSEYREASKQGTLVETPPRVVNR